MNVTQYPGLGEQVYRRQLENGLQVTVVRRPGFSKKLAYFVTDYGSMHTDFVLDGQQYSAPAGVAHYLEHKMFDMPGGRDVSEEFAQLGANVNAFTGYDMTAYYFSCTEGFDQALKLLLEFVSTPYFTEESVAREQGIIGQEIDMTADNPDTRAFENLMSQMYCRHPIRIPILGTRQTIAQITPQVLELCHRAFYAPENMMLCVVGDVEAEQVAQIALEVLGTQRLPAGKKLPLPAEDLGAPQPYRRESMEVSMPLFQLGFQCEPLGKGEEAFRQEIIADLAAEALFGESSKLYLQLYEQGIIDSSFGGGLDTVDGVAMLTASGDSYEPEKVRDAILQAAGELAREGIDEDTFRRMKRSAYGRRIRALDSFDSTCFRMCAYQFSEFDYLRFPQVYDRVERADLQEFLGRVVTEARCSLSVIVPAKEDAYESQ